MKEFVRRLATIVLLFLAMLLPLLFTSHANAALQTCRTDPIIHFSDGSKLIITAKIDTDLANLSNITYTVHVPQNLIVEKIVYTSRDKGAKEIVFVISDQPSGAYNVDILVTTTVPNVSVTATAGLIPNNYRTVSGYSGEHLFISLE